MDVLFKETVNALCKFSQEKLFTLLLTSKNVYSVLSEEIKDQAFTTKDNFISENAEQGVWGANTFKMVETRHKDCANDCAFGFQEPSNGDIFPFQDPFQHRFLTVGEAPKIKRSL